MDKHVAPVAVAAPRPLALPTGHAAFDDALGVGGLALGRLVELQSTSPLATTTLALRAAAETQARGGVVAYIDGAQSFDAQLMKSMGVRVNAETLKQQLEITGQLYFLKLPYHQAVIKGQVPLSIGGGIGQSRTVMLLLRKAHLGEVSVSVWPKRLKEICRKKNIQVLE